jgi:hypothetical protein
MALPIVAGCRLSHIPLNVHGGTSARRRGFAKDAPSAAQSAGTVRTYAMMRLQQATRAAAATMPANLRWLCASIVVPANMHRRPVWAAKPPHCFAKAESTRARPEVA